MNKKSLILLLSVASAFAFATTPNYYDASTNTSTFSQTTSSNTDPILDDSLTNTYDGIDKAAITVSGGMAQYQSATVGNFSKDFTFNSGITLNNTGDYDGSFYFRITNDSTLTFKSSMGFSGSKLIHYRFLSVDANNRGNVVIDTNVSTGDVWKTQMWFEGVDVNYNGTDNDGTFGYTHFSTGATLTATKNLEISHLALRSLGKDIEGNDTYGSLIIDKATVTIGSFIINNLNVSGGDYRVEFANANSAEALVIKGVNSVTKFNDQEIALDFIDFGKDDKIYSAVDLTTFNDITVNGTALSTLLTDGTIDVDTGSYDDVSYNYVYSLVTVPEPSTYALIFGALALSFVAYRRRK